MTVDLMLSVSRIAIAMRSYERSEKIIERIHHVTMSDDTIRNVTNDVGRIVYEYDCHQAEEAKRLFENNDIKRTYNKEGILYLSTDGAFVNTRQVVDNSGWHESKLGMSFTNNDIECYKSASNENAMRILQKRYIALIGEVSEYQWHMLALALSSGYGKYKKTVLLGDGASWIRNMRKRLFSDTVQILDLYHLKENVGRYGTAMIKGKNHQARSNEWIQKTCDELEAGNWKKTLEDIEKRFGEKKPPKGIVNLPKYLYDNRDSINYSQYRDEGFITSTASMESSNKTVTQDRLKGPGMRWDIQNGQGVLALKAKEEGNEWSIVEKLVHTTYS